MLHPPRTKADIEAKQAEAMLHKMVGSIIIVFSEEIHSGHMMVLAARSPGANVPTCSRSTSSRCR